MVLIVYISSNMDWTKVGQLAMTPAIKEPSPAHYQFCATRNATASRLFDYSLLGLITFLTLKLIFVISVFVCIIEKQRHIDRRRSEKNYIDSV